MAEQTPLESAEGEGRPGGEPLVKKIFKKAHHPQAEGEVSDPGEQGVARVPATVLTVEYVDDSEGMDAELKAMNERLRKLEQQLEAIKESQGQMVSALNQQAADLVRNMESVARRVDKLYREIAGLGEAELEEGRDEGTRLSAPPPLPPDVADDPEHQNAWRIARVLVADLEAYHEQEVKEGIMYGTLFQILKEPIEQARRTYEERVSKEIAENYDYFSRALDELIARRKQALEGN